jgi:spermidine synthase
MAQDRLTIQPPQFSRLLSFLFFCSGASSLIFESIFTRLLTYTFGNTAQAVSTVLAAFLGGLAIGAYCLGRWVDRWGPSLWIYGVLELFIGILCWFTPKTFAFLTPWYATLYHHYQLSSAGLTAIRFALSGLVILLPTILMGGTFPVVARYVAAVLVRYEDKVDRLYALNTLGAACGTILGTYILMPSLGVRATVGLACAIDIAIFLAVIIFSSAPAGGAASQADSLQPTSQGSSVGAEVGTKAGTLILLAAFLAGAVALAYEVVWTHALAFLVGNTVYAFGSMLFTFLCGLGMGAQVVSRRLNRPSLWAKALAASQFLLGLSVFVTVPLWSFIPDLFVRGLRMLEYELLLLALVLTARVGYLAWSMYHGRTGRPPARARVIEPLIEVGGIAVIALAIIVYSLVFASQPATLIFLHRVQAALFVGSELARLLCVFYFLIVPCFFLGLSFPLFLNLWMASPERTGRRVGGIYAANTFGSILGSVGMAFVLLPRLGSLSSIRACATVNVALGLFLALWLVPLSRAQRWGLLAAACALPFPLWLGMGGWDARRMTSGSYVYFDPGYRAERVLYYREDVEGGLTTVIQNGEVKTLLSNGKFQGDDNGQIPAQVRFALIPVLFTRRFDRALVIGLGTGNTLRTLCRFPFESIEVADISPNIVDAARLWFGDVNGEVFDRDPRVAMHIADGRNFLLLSSAQYDLITVEVSSIWISGEADLYNKEFYELCRAHLREGGVLQQWVQLHHMETKTLLVLLNTAAQVFPHALFFVGPNQALLIASAAPLECDFPRIDAFDRDQGVSQELNVIGRPSMFCLLSEMALDEPSYRKAVSFLPRYGLPRELASTDMMPYLEYQTPKGNALPYGTVAINTEWLDSFRLPPLSVSQLVRNLPSESERELVAGYIAEGRGETEAAMEFFRNVKGPLRDWAGIEMARLRSIARHSPPQVAPAPSH